MLGRYFDATRGSWPYYYSVGTLNMPPLGEACVCVPLVVTGIRLNYEGMTLTNLEVYHDVAV